MDEEKNKEREKKSIIIIYLISSQIFYKYERILLASFIYFLEENYGRMGV